VVSCVIIILNTWLLVQTLQQWFGSLTGISVFLKLPLFVLAGALGLLLLYMIIRPAILSYQRLSLFKGRLAVKGISKEGAMYQRVLVPIEVSSADQTIIDHIKPLAKANRSRLILFHVADGWAPRFYGEEADSVEVREDREYLEKLAGELRQEGLEVDTRMAFGDPGDEIIKFAASEPIDLIAMTTHGHGFFQDLIYGSAVHKVRHTVTIPLLLLKVAK
jgi:manganese transport protein